MSELRKKSKERPVVGTCCLSTSPEFFAATMAAGLDFVFIDTEHVAIPRDKLSWMCRAYAGAGVVPIVRVPEPEPFRVCEYIDGGALGIVAPYVESLDQVLTLVGAVKLRPLKGKRLEGCLRLLKTAAHELMSSDTGDSDSDSPITVPSMHALLQAEFGEELCEYVRKKNENLQLFINIESVPALGRLPALLSVPGLDGVFIGPADLSVSLGVPRQWHDETFHAAVTEIIRETRRRGLSVGCHYSFDRAVEYQKKWVSEGADMIVHASDVSLYSKALSLDLQSLRELGTPAGSGQSAGSSQESCETVDV